MTHAMASKVPTIIKNIESMGNHICPYIHTSKSSYMARTKINKFVLNFKASEIRKKVGDYLSDYTDCPNEHLCKTFLHPNVEVRGCTHKEVLLYACHSEVELSADTANFVVQEALDTVLPDLTENEVLFVVQPPARQWKNLAKELDQCVILADRPQGKIFVAWYAHPTMGRIAGVRIRPTKANVDEDTCWEIAVQWAASDFG